MRLSDKERSVLAAYELRANAPVHVIRKETGLRDHTIRYALNSLLDRKVITPVPLVNMHALGHMVFNIFFSIGAEKKSEKEALLRALQQEKDVTWVGEFGGEFQYGLAVCSPSMRTVVELLDGLSKRFKRLFFEKSISSQLGTTCYYRKYLAPKRFKVEPLSTGFLKESVEIDALDDRILVALVSYPHFSRRQLSQQMKIPLSTLELRIKKLEEKGVICGYMYAPDPTKMGMQAYKLLVYAKGIDRELSREIKRFAEAHPDIVYVIECLGNWDYEIGVEAARTEEVSDIIQEIYERFGNSVNSVKLLSKFRDLKIRWYPGNSMAPA